MGEGQGNGTRRGSASTSGKVSMAIRVISILIVASLGLYVYTTHRQAEQPPPEIQHDQPPKFFNPEVKGVVPEIPPEFDVVVRMVPRGEQTRLEFTVTERHGWYVDNVYIEFWHVEKDEHGKWQQVGDSVRWLCRGYLDFNSVLTDSTVLTAQEWPDLDDYGETENWRARVVQYSNVYAPAS